MTPEQMEQNDRIQRATREWFAQAEVDAWLESQPDAVIELTEEHVDEGVSTIAWIDNPSW